MKWLCALGKEIHRSQPREKSDSEETVWENKPDSHPAEAVLEDKNPIMEDKVHRLEKEILSGVSFRSYRMNTTGSMLQH